jgi:hypothetical protein
MGRRAPAGQAGFRRAAAGIPGCGGKIRAASQSAFLTLVAMPILTPRAVSVASRRSVSNRKTELMTQGSTRVCPGGPVRTRYQSHG